jgi:Protein of unknown function (DUF2281)
MTTADRIYALVNTLPPVQANEVLNFVEFLQQKIPRSTNSESYEPINPTNILTGLRGLAKRAGANLAKEALSDNYTNYLSNKYQ